MAIEFGGSRDRIATRKSDRAARRGCPSEKYRKERSLVLPHLRRAAGATRVAVMDRLRDAPEAEPSSKRIRLPEDRPTRGKAASDKTYYVTKSRSSAKLGWLAHDKGP